ncbi:MAG: alkaline phosphatase family protein [Acidithiobacillales bacterium]
MLIGSRQSSRAAAPLLLLALAAAAPAAAASRGRVVVLGFDGADHELVSKWMAEGKLPNLSKLAAEGSFASLRPTIPAQTPVSWSTFSTGLSPGRTLIFDFLKRDPKTYRPEFAIEEEGKKPFLFGKGNRVAVPALLGVVAFVLVGGLLKILLRRRGRAALAGGLLAAAVGGVLGIRLSSLLPSEIPTVKNNRRGVPFWEAAAKQGIRSVVMHVPVTFPAADFAGGRLISGLGVPDIRGRIGTPSYYTSDPFFMPKNKNEFSVELIRLESNTGTIKTEVFGPYNKLFKKPPIIKIPMTLTVEGGTALRIEPKGSGAVTLKPGEWSPWVVFTFPFNSLVKITGIGRFHLATLSPEIQLYLSPIHFNPTDLPPSVKITAPAALARRLVKRYGLYKTMGWKDDTWSMSEETIDEKTFLEDVDFTREEFRRMMDGFLAEKDVDLFVQIYEYTDRVAHCFWRFIDPKHPAYDPVKAARWGPAIQTSYEQMDDIVGDAMRRLGPDDLLLVVSDHGFSSWRRSVNYNTWLVEHGFLGLTGAEGKEADLEQLFGQGEFWPNVDWSKTKAYSMGLGEIYINLKGREGKGTVAPGAEYEKVRREIADGLLAVVDPKTGEHPVSRVFTREEAYGAFDADLIPDLFVTNSRGYRVSWQSSLGVVTKEMFEDNKQVWSGDHCSLDPDLVPGILFSSRKLETGNAAAIADVPATILKALGVPPPEKLDGVPLF